MTVTKAFGVRVLGLFGILSACEAGADWKPIGPTGGGKIDPVFVSDAYVLASSPQGVWRSADRGGSWTFIQPEINAIYFREVGTKLYEAAYRKNLPSLQILESSDHGTTWKSRLEGVARADSMAWQGIRESAWLGRYWVVTSRDGIYRSPDSGVTWKRIADLPWPNDYQSNQVFGQSASLIVVNETGYYRSLDSGSSWEKLPSGLPPGVSFPVQPLGRYLIGFHRDSTYRSSDLGATWQRFHSPSLFSLNSEDNGRLYARAEGDNSSLLMFSSDSGESWAWIGLFGGSPNSLTSLATVGDTLFAGTNAMGVYRSFKLGADFEQTSLPSQDVAILAANGTSLWAGARGGGGLFRLDGNANGWIQAQGTALGFGSINAIAFDGETIVVADSSGSVRITRDGGTTWSEPPLSGAGVTSINAIAVKNGSLLLASNGCVYRFFDIASEWRCVQPLPRRNSIDDAKFLVTSGAVFLGDSAGVIRSRDGGAHWDTVNHGLEGEVRFLAEGAGWIYAVGTRGVFRSQDEGDSWTRMNPDRTRFKSLATVGQALFAGNDSGVFVSIDEGKNWALANEGMSVSTFINSLAVFGEDLYAGTDASVWKRPLSELVPGTINVSGSGMAARSLIEMRVIRTGRGPAVAFNVPAKNRVRLDMYDFSGRQVGNLVDKVLDQGPAEALLSGSGISSGGYILRLRTGGQQRTVKIALTP
ncbi:MAG: hypothetical protein JF616_18830 [Fibrobacteres bacterium]|nr:hypothetical protein [Fibrobacterota bacterium]